MVAFLAIGGQPSRSRQADMPDDIDGFTYPRTNLLPMKGGGGSRAAYHYYVLISTLTSATLVLQIPFRRTSCKSDSARCSFQSLGASDIPEPTIFRLSEHPHCQPKTLEVGTSTSKSACLDIPVAQPPACPAAGAFQDHCFRSTYSRVLLPYLRL